MNVPSGRKAAVLVARSAFAGASAREIEQVAERLNGHDRIDRVTWAFTEQGEPALRDVVMDLVGDGLDELLVLPLMLPVEPGQSLWLLRALQRWQHADLGRPWPVVRVGPSPAQCDALQALLEEMLSGASRAEPAAPVPETSEGSLVSTQKRRVLVCLGGPCNNQGAGLVWGRLRNLQKELGLASAGNGTVSCKSSCLGPCSLGAVVQVYPEGTIYGGVDEEGIDRIIEEHVIGGRVVEMLAYEPSPVRQKLRPTS